MASEWLLTNGVVWTGTEEVEAIAIRGDRIIPIGSEDEVKAGLARIRDQFLTVDEEVIPDVRSVLTMIGGRVVHSAAPFENLV